MADKRKPTTLSKASHQPTSPHLCVDELRVHAHARRLQPAAAHFNVGLQRGPLVAQALQLGLQSRRVAHFWATGFTGSALAECALGLSIGIKAGDSAIAAGLGCKCWGPVREWHLSPLSHARYMGAAMALLVHDSSTRITDLHRGDGKRCDRAPAERLGLRLHHTLRLLPFPAIHDIRNINLASQQRPQPCPVPPVLAAAAAPAPHGPLDRVSMAQQNLWHTLAASDSVPSAGATSMFEMHGPKQLMCCSVLAVPVPYCLRQPAGCATPLHSLPCRCGWAED